MARPTHIAVDVSALKHNLASVRACAPKQQIVAMVKADAYACGVPFVVPALEDNLDAFGVASLEEAIAVRQYTQKPCILFEGVFTPDELAEVVKLKFEIVIHEKMQLEWLLNTPLDKPVRVWVKIDTGMHRLGFMPDEASDVIAALKTCPWIDNTITVMTHLASADTPQSTQNQLQYQIFQDLQGVSALTQSIANSAAILSYANTDKLFDVVRPGIMLYGVSPFFDQDGTSIGLKPVMQLISKITAIHDILPGETVGYGATWQAERPSKIAVVAVGYGDGYPRHIAPNTPVYIENQFVPIVGRVSMDMLMIDITDFKEITIGNRVELWGANLPVERIARAAGTIGYELLTQISPRVRAQAVVI
ncbi:MAG: alanine racemase [Legionella sp.]|nr:alanine racemase [Legionella sp.]